MSTYSVPVITQTSTMAVHQQLPPVPQSPHDPNQQPLTLPHQGHVQGHPQLFWAQYPQVQTMPVPAHMMAVPMCEVKARLTREQLNYLESIFQQNSRPTSAMKRGFAEAMRVPVEKINNWFQNRRAKVKQEIKKAQHAAAAQAEQQNAEQGEHRNGVIVPEGVRQYSTPSSDQGTSSVPPAILPSNDTSGAPEMSPTTILHTSIPQIFPEPTYASPLSQDRYVDHPPVSHVTSTTYSIPEEVLAPPPTLHFDQMAVPYTVGSEFGGLGGMLLNTAFVPESDQYFMSPVPEASIEDSPLPPKAGINVVVSSAAPELPNGIPTPTYSEACMPHVKMEFSPLPWTPDAEVKTISRDSPLDPLDSRNSDSKPAGHDTPIDASGWPSHIDSLNGYFPPHFSENTTPAVSVTPELEAQPLNVGIMEPPEFPSQAYDRRCSSTTTLVDSLGNVSIQAPFPLQNDLKKPSQTIAARRQRRPAALNSSAFRSASYSHGMPSPGCLTAPPDLNLRKIKSTGVAIGSRISKPLNSAGPKSPFQFDMYCSSPSFQNEIHSSSVSTPSFFITTPGWWSSEDVQSTDSFEGMEKSRLETTY